METGANFNRKHRSYSVSKTHKLAWAAGFFDGDGYVTVQVRGGKYRGHYLVVGVNHVAEEPIKELIKLFGGSFRKQNLRKIVGNRKQRVEWKITCSKAANFLTQIRPYLVNKVDVVNKALELQSTMSTTQKVPESILELRSKLKEEIRELNAMN